jgi:DNA-binding NarL/FixJ family response regulator
MVVVGEATDLPGLRSQVARHLPDLILVDWELPDLQPTQFLQQLHEQYPALNVVALSSHPEAQVSALAAGVDAFVSKGDVPERLLLTLHRLAAWNRG